MSPEPSQLFDLGAGDQLSNWDQGMLPATATNFAFPDWTEGAMSLADLFRNPADEWWNL